MVLVALVVRRTGSQKPEQIVKRELSDVFEGGSPAQTYCFGRGSTATQR